MPDIVSKFGVENGMFRHRVMERQGNGNLKVVRDVVLCPEWDEAAVVYNSHTGDVLGFGPRQIAEALANKIRQDCHRAGQPAEALAIATVAFMPTQYNLDLLNSCLNGYEGIDGFAARVAAPLTTRNPLYLN